MRTILPPAIENVYGEAVFFKRIATEAKLNSLRCEEFYWRGCFEREAGARHAYLRRVQRRQIPCYPARVPSQINDPPLEIPGFRPTGANHLIRTEQPFSRLRKRRLAKSGIFARKLHTPGGSSGQARLLATVPERGAALDQDEPSDEGQGEPAKMEDGRWKMARRAANTEEPTANSQLRTLRRGIGGLASGTRRRGHRRYRLPSVLCPLSSVLCPLSSALRPPSSALCPPSSVLRPPPSALRPPPSDFSISVFQLFSFCLGNFSFCLFEFQLFSPLF